MSSEPHPQFSTSSISPALQPWDEFNQKLQSRVRPAEWSNPTPDGRYNLVVIGGGTAGLVTAAGAAGLGAKVALIESNLLGGDCLNLGCVPSKALIRCARAAADVRRASRLGISVPEGTVVDFSAVMRRMRELRAVLSPHDSAARFRQLGVDVFLGRARFVSRDCVEVNGQLLEFARSCIATGAKAAVPWVPGLKEAGYLTNETIFSLETLPRRLAVIGAGPLGCELAQVFARLGSEVHLLESQHGIMPQDDPDAAEIVRQSLLQDGARLICCGKNLRVDHLGGEKRITVDSHGGHYDFWVDEILVAAGRAANVEDLGLEAAKVECDSSGVKVNDFLQTSNRQIYAAGDVCSRYKFTHAADAMARIVVQNALFFGFKRVSSLTIPHCTYTDPEVAHVGLTPRDAQRQGIAIDSFRINLSEVDRAVLDGDTDGFLKVHVRRGSDKIVGATIVARHAGDMISELTLAMRTGRGLRHLASVIHPYPTHAEAIRKASDLYNRTRLKPWLKNLFATILRWRR